jgi:hypothetical protein
MQYLDKTGLAHFYSKLEQKEASKPYANITSNDISNWNNKSNFSGSYTDLIDKPNIPTSTSQLTNNSNFVSSNHVSNIIVSNTEPTSTSSGDIWFVYEE